MKLMRMGYTVVSATLTLLLLRGVQTHWFAHRAVAASSGDQDDAVYSFLTPSSPSVEWLDAHEHMSTPELLAERLSIAAELRALAMPEYKKRFDSGASEFVSSSLSYESRPNDFLDLVGVTHIPNKGTFRTTLPREEYPELWKMRDEVTWIYVMVHSRKREPRPE